MHCDRSPGRGGNVNPYNQQLAARSRKQRQRRENRPAGRMKTYSSLSAFPDRHAEDVIVLAVVVPELELRDVQRQILGADLVERADDPALEDRPEAFNRVRVDRTDNILAGRVIDGGF